MLIVASYETKQEEREKREEERRGSCVSAFCTLFFFFFFFLSLPLSYHLGYDLVAPPPPRCVSLVLMGGPCEQCCPPFALYFDPPPLPPGISKSTCPLSFRAQPYYSTMTMWWHHQISKRLVWTGVRKTTPEHAGACSSALSFFLAHHASPFLAASLTALGSACGCLYVLWHCMIPFFLCGFNALDSLLP